MASPASAPPSSSGSARTWARVAAGTPPASPPSDAAAASLTSAWRMALAWTVRLSFHATESTPTTTSVSLNGRSPCSSQLRGQRVKVRRRRWPRRRNLRCRLAPGGSTHAPVGPPAGVSTQAAVARMRPASPAPIRRSRASEVRSTTTSVSRTRGGRRGLRRCRVTL